MKWTPMLGFFLCGVLMTSQGQAQTQFQKKVHVVQKGETMYKISKQYKMTVAQIKSLNKMTANTLKAGQDLMVAVPAATQTTPVAATPSPVPTPVVSAPIKMTKAVHVVEKGETMYRIAKQYNMTVAQVKSLNDMKANALKIGQDVVVTVPMTAQVATETAPAIKSHTIATPAKVEAPPKADLPEEVLHLVSKGETLYMIAKLYDTNVSTLKALNSGKVKSLSEDVELLIRPKMGAVKVKKGDSLSKLSRTNKVKSTEFMFSNGESVLPEDVRQGQILWYRTGNM